MGNGIILTSNLKTKHCLKRKKLMDTDNSAVIAGTGDREEGGHSGDKW